MDLRRHLAPGPPGRWQKAVLAIIPVVITVSLYERRGWAVAGAAALFYGLLVVISIVAWDRLVRWGSRHPAIDSAFFGAFLFFALACVPSVPLGVCLALGVAGSAAAVGLSGVRRARRRAKPAAQA